MRHLFVLGAVVLLTGCRSSTRSIQLNEGVLAFKPATFIQPQPAIGLAASRNGEMYAVAVLGPEPKTYRVEVRNYGDVEPIVSYLLDQENALVPIMFSSTGDLICTSKQGLRSLNVETGRSTSLTKGGSDHWPSHRNFEHSIVVADQGKRSLIVTETGKVLESSFFGGFDQYGRAWTKRNGLWTSIDRSGVVTSGFKSAPYLVLDQSEVRGAMRIDTKSIDQEHKGGTARVSVVWLVHEGAIPTPDQKAIIKAAPAFVGLDVYATGFVPGRNEIYIVSSMGTSLVPFEIRRSYD